MLLTFLVTFWLMVVASGIVFNLLEKNWAGTASKPNQEMLRGLGVLPPTHPFLSGPALSR